MMKSLIGYHTFSIFQRLSMEDEAQLDSDFSKYMLKNDQMDMYIPPNKKGETIGTIYFYKNDIGITWLVLDRYVGKNFRIYGVQARINPNAMFNQDYIEIATASDVQKCKSIFNDEARKISPILGDFDSYSMSRSDYCANFDLEELKIPCTTEQMMKLLKRGDIPAHFTERTEYNPISHRPKTCDSSFYLENGSVVANCYDKSAQLANDKNHPCRNKEGAKNRVRFEIQCKNRKLHAIAKNRMSVATDAEPSAITFSNEQEIDGFYRDILTRLKTTLPIDAFLSDAISYEIIDKYFRKIVRSGDYYTLARARQIIESSDCYPKRKEKLIKVLEMTNSCRGIYNTKMTLTDKKDLLDYNRLLIELDRLGINPVTIPRAWGIEYIPNLLNAYYDKCAEVRKEETLQGLMERFAEQNKRGKKFKKNHVFTSLR